MFHIGDKIFYPMHGAGIIEAIEDKDFLGEKRPYYIVNIPSKNMNVMVPKGKEDQLHLRKVIDPDSFENLISSLLAMRDEDQPVHPNQRHRIFLDKIKSGDFLEGVKVIRDLKRISKEKNLGAADKNMLANAEQILISELAMAKNMNEDQATQYLDQVINQ
ncbi:CarD family transcriptional regulator [Salirhabdus sp. Marseille-P4669]|uniref:CarD family transcriptional regulator n=1 Tax=Salirhabdus sp. Marseille-P4669 TaxID=2042310 RepID=UPI000C79AA20|nr:CarD family transcriptional regulator [Salirhabdus sp. Marseille-P4669]